MTINYRLSFNHTLRWIDCRHTRGEVISGKTVLAYIMCDKIANPTIVMISNYKSMRELHLVGPKEAIYCGIIGAGLIEHPLFSALIKPTPISFLSNTYDVENAIHIGFSSHLSGIIISDESTIDSFSTHRPKYPYKWGVLQHIEIQSRPIALAIPVQQISAR